MESYFLVNLLKLNNMNILKLILYIFFIGFVLNINAQWTLIEKSEQFLFEDILFINSDEGFVVGKTFDGGNDWFDCCGVILHTLDGGSIWDTTLLDFAVRCIFFLDSDTGFAASNHLVFYKTYDGGANWETIVINNAVPGFLPIHQFTSLYFKNSQEGYMSGHTGTLGRKLFRTYDGGYTWETEIPVSNYINDLAGGSQVSFPTPLIGYVGNRHKSIDGGFTWYRTDSMVTPVPESAGIYQCVDFLTNKYGMIGYNYITHNPHNWRVGFIGITNDGVNFDYHYFPEIDRIYDLEIVNEKISFAAGNYHYPDANENTSSILASFDSGDTWYYQNVLPDSIHPKLNKIQSLTEKIAYAVGYSETDFEGLIYKTTNAGGELIPITPLTVVDHDVKRNRIEIYPNPTNKILHISFSFVNPAELEIFSATGQLLRKFKSNRQEICLDISDLTPGNYFIRTISQENVNVKKFTVVR